MGVCGRMTPKVEGLNWLVVEVHCYLYCSCVPGVRESH